MTTKIRLILDFIIQTTLVIILIVRCVQAPSEVLQHLSIFAITISIWQILHAFYVVQKYKDWERERYLDYIRQIMIYVFLTVGIGFLMVLTSFGFLYPFFVFVLDILRVVLCVGVTVLAMYSFWQSLRGLYRYYYRPRSFWDL